VLIEWHAPEEDRGISNVFGGFRYRAYRLDNRKWVERPNEVHPDNAGVWALMRILTG
jgi:hypothetical protein